MSPIVDLEWEKTFDNALSHLPVRLQIFINTKDDTTLQFIQAITAELESRNMSQEQNNDQRKENESTLLKEAQEQIEVLKSELQKSREESTNKKMQKYLEKRNANYTILADSISKLVLNLHKRRAYEKSIMPKEAEDSENEDNNMVELTCELSNNTPYQIEWKYGDENKSLQIDKEVLKKKVGIGKDFNVDQFALFLFQQSVEVLAPRIFSPRATEKTTGLKPWPKELVDWAIEFAFENRVDKNQDRGSVWKDLKDKLGNKRHDWISNHSSKKRGIELNAKMDENSKASKMPKPTPEDSSSDDE